VPEGAQGTLPGTPAHAEPQAATPRRHRLRKAVLGGAVALTLLVAAEGSLRALPAPAIDRHEFTHNAVYWTFAADQHDLGVRHAERASLFQLSTNAHGLRPPHHDVQRTPGTFRILALGDSTTFGWGVEDTQTWPWLLERELAGPQGNCVEVVNGGQPGHTTFQGLRFWREVGQLYQPDLVLVGYIVQDAREVSYTDRSQAVLQSDGDFLSHHPLWTLQLYRALHRAIGRARQDLVPANTRRVPLDQYADNLRTFADQIRSVGAEPVLFGFPLEVAGYTAEHRAVQAATAGRLGLEHIDLSDLTAGRSELYFAEDRGHANARGNRAVAEALAAWMRTNPGLVDRCGPLPPGTGEGSGRGGESGS